MIWIFFKYKLQLQQYPTPYPLPTPLAATQANQHTGRGEQYSCQGYSLLPEMLLNPQNPDQIIRLFFFLSLSLSLSQ